jgi:hypothetical protein
VRRPPGTRPDRAALSSRPHHAYGIALDLLDGIGGDGLAAGHGGALLPPTAVALGDVPALPDAAVTRELRDGDRLLFSVAHAAGTGHLLTMPGYGRFLVDERGLTVRCAPDGGDGWTDALAIHALPLACTLRGLEPFHASGAALGDAALMIAGRVTAGKSSLAAALVEGGADLLADDVVAVDEALRAHPGPRRISLRDPPASSRRLRPAGRRDGRARFDAPLAGGPRRLRAIYVLARGAGEPPIGALPASGVELLAATYNLSVRDPARLRRQLALSHAIAARIPLFRLAVTPGRDAASLAGLVREHFEAT